MFVRHFVRAVAVAALLCAAARLGAQNTVTVNGTPTLRVNAAVAGFAPTVVSVSTTTYTFDTVNSNASLQARLQSALPSGVTLEVSVVAPGGATSNGYVALTANYQDLTSQIPRSLNGTYTITHRLTATSAAGVLAAQSVTIRFRLN